MSTNLVEQATKPKKVSVKKKVVKAKKGTAAKKSTKKGAKGKASKSTSGSNGAAPRKVKEGLRKPQLRVLEALSKQKKPLSRKGVAKVSSVDEASLSGYIGANDPEIRAKDDAEKGWPCLLTLKLLKIDQMDEEGRSKSFYSITKAGRDALDKHQKAAKAAKK